MSLQQIYPVSDMPTVTAPHRTAPHRTGNLDANSRLPNKPTNRNFTVTWVATRDIS